MSLCTVCFLAAVLQLETGNFPRHANPYQFTRSTWALHTTAPYPARPARGNDVRHRPVATRHVAYLTEQTDSSSPHRLFFAWRCGPSHAYPCKHSSHLDYAERGVNLYTQLHHEH